VHPCPRPLPSSPSITIQSLPTTSIIAVLYPLTCSSRVATQQRAQRPSIYPCVKTIPATTVIAASSRRVPRRQNREIFSASPRLSSYIEGVKKLSAIVQAPSKWRPQIPTTPRPLPLSPPPLPAKHQLLSTSHNNVTAHPPRYRKHMPKHRLHSRNHSSKFIKRSKVRNSMVMTHMRLEKRKTSV